MTTLARIEARFREADWRRLLLWTAAAVPYLIGVTVGYALYLLWIAAAWLWAAAMIGWQAGFLDRQRSRRERTTPGDDYVVYRDDDLGT